jgi:uncharacterized cupredoxin-like copper-binding protein
MSPTRLVHATMSTLAATVLAASVACGGGGAAVHATLADDSIGLDPTSTAAGKLSFQIQNAGTTIHEFEIFRTDLAPDRLPVDGSVVNDEGLEIVDEVEEIAPGTGATLTVDLSPGSYVMICNLPDHYARGMHSGFTVT